MFEIAGNFIYRIHSGHELVLLLPCDVENPIGVLPPLAFDNVPYFLYGVELTTLRRKKLTHEPYVIELVLHDLAVVDLEVFHHHNPLLQWVNSLERLNER